MFDFGSLIPVLSEAGEAILARYQDQGTVTFKEDRSPLTEADRVSHRILQDGLNRLYPDIPVLSEEGEQHSYEVRKNWEYFFLIDPLDGTKGFLRKDGEFAINIALIDKGKAVAGLIHAPVTGITYSAELGSGAHRYTDQTEQLPLPDSHPEVKVVLSRDDSSAELSELLQMISGVSIHRMSSSLKFCMLAEGSVDFYPRKRPSMEWDTAAGAILVEEAGGLMLEDTGEEISYNRENLLNPPFFAFNRQFQMKVANWKKLLFKEKNFEVNTKQ